MKTCGGQGTNNLAELLALELLIKKAFEISFSSLQVFGNSSFVMNWVNSLQEVHNLHLRGLADSLNEAVVV